MIGGVTIALTVLPALCANIKVDAVLKHVPTGFQFSGVTKTGRVIPLGKVTGKATFDCPYPHYVTWYDENGKHHENFNLHKPFDEFKEFTVIHNPCMEEV